LKQEEKISNLENASQKSYSLTFDYLQKNIEKDLQKNLQKQKQVVQAWSKMLKMKKQSMHIL
jgi:DNA topoisomerase IB